MILSFRTDMQTVQTQIRSSLIRVYTVCYFVCIGWTHFSIVEPHSSNLQVITTNFLGVRIFRKFTVSLNCHHRSLIFSALNHSSFHRCGFEPSLGHVRQAKFCLWVVRWFFLWISRFHPTLRLTRLKMSEIILMGHKTQIKNLKNVGKSCTRWDCITLLKYTVFFFPSNSKPQITCLVTDVLVLCC